MVWNGLIHLPWWGYIVVVLVLTHVTIASVTIFLHRCQAHRALDLHPIVSHFFRFWLWLTTGMVTKAWASIHRKHHAKVETAEDPHSPQIVGLHKVLFEGTELYKEEAKNRETLDKYGHGTPDDWIERNLYSRHTVLGVTIMVFIDVILFGTIGITMWAVQMMWIPFFAAGVVNGVGHYWGYRNFQMDGDASSNIVPWGILIGGEELHNNHHAYASSAKLSNRWFEFDIGWLYIRLMQVLGLAKVKKVAPKLKVNRAKTQCDAETLQAILTHRYAVMAKFVKSMKSTCHEEISRLGRRAGPALYDVAAMKAVKRWLHRDPENLGAHERAKLNEILANSRVLKTVYTMRQELAQIWSRGSATGEQLVRQLEDWCLRAEASGIIPLQEFSRRLRCYA
ncbi:MAG: DesA family fatty acid desaturase [Burkholderiales bacterium]